MVPPRTQAQFPSCPVKQGLQLYAGPNLRKTFRRHVDEAREQKRRALEPLEQRRRMMAQKHREERRELIGYQKDRWQDENRQRSARLKSGIGGIWQRLSGEHARIRRQNEQEAYAALMRDRQRRERLIFTQLNERRGLQAQIKVVRKEHATVFREIRQDQQHYRQMERDTGSAPQRAFQQVSPDRARTRSPTTAERLDRLRTQKPIQNIRGKGPERER